MLALRPFMAALHPFMAALHPFMAAPRPRHSAIRPLMRRVWCTVTERRPGEGRLRRQVRTLAVQELQRRGERQETLREVVCWPACCLRLERA
eukprot:3456347-Rhodomonas_salina.2